ncbi:MAG: tetratricopeptide repeat protein [Planctomycetota bacterium]
MIRITISIMALLLLVFTGVAQDRQAPKPGGRKEIAGEIAPGKVREFRLKPGVTRAFRYRATVGGEASIRVHTEDRDIMVTIFGANGGRLKFDDDLCVGMDAHLYVPVTKGATFRLLLDVMVGGSASGAGGVSTQPCQIAIIETPATTAMSGLTERIGAVIKKIRRLRKWQEGVEARRVGIEFIAGLEKTLPNVIDRGLTQALLSLAVQLHYGSDTESAIRIWQILDLVREATLPATHPDMQRARRDAAAVLDNLGDLAGTRRFYNQIIDACETVIPVDVAEVLTVREYYASALFDLGDVRGAKVLLEKALMMQEKLLAGNHPDLQDSRESLALVLRALGKFERARGLFGRALKVREAAPTVNDLEVAWSRENYALTLLDLGEKGGARALLKQVLEARANHGAIDDPAYLRSVVNYASTFTGTFERSTSRNLRFQVRKVRRLHEKSLPDDHPERQKMRQRLAETLKAIHASDGNKTQSVPVPSTPPPKTPLPPQEPFR